ncbi:MAG: FAD-dependent oxidoreductase [Desulfobacterales bacterium]|nr:FAD-dependent oxidoreductase [Desulfobacterales bacterium]
MEKLPLGLVIDLNQVVPYKTGSWRTLMPVNIMQTPPCTNSCPAGNDIRGFLRVLAEKEDYEQAWHVLTRTNPLPATCGRVCPHPCEAGCNRRDFDSSVAINSSERCVGDYGLENNLEHKKLVAGRKEKIAVIGSGPAGLSCAFHLAKRGFKVKIFEANSEPGGMMRYGIPPYRLPNYILQQEIDNILRLGIELECNIKVGVNIPLDQLTREYNAIFLGIGAQIGTSINVPGKEAENIYTGVDFLKQVNSGKWMEIGSDVVVIGGGNTAMDCARVAKRLGANVSVVYRRTRTEMPAITAEIDEAMEERIMFRYHTNPVKFITDEGRVVGILSVQMELKEPDASGRARPVPIAGSEAFIPADTVIMATGQAVDYDGIDVQSVDNQWMYANEHLMTSMEGVFAGGDAVAGLETVSLAIGQGTRAASSIEDYIEGNVESTLAQPPVVYSRDLNTYYYNKQKPFTKEAVSIHTRLKNFREIYPSFDLGDIIKESQRCFSCGLCFHCNNCYMYCPDNAVKISPSTGGFEFDLDFCKGCGLCAKECPCHYIQLTLEK